MNNFTKTKETLNEAVRVDHARYMRSHGKKPKGGQDSWGSWMFTSKYMGDVDWKNEKEVFQFQGNLADATKAAQAWAKNYGHSTVYTME